MNKAKRQQRLGGGKSGSVLIEFAFTFPMLLLTFVFSWQLLQVYNYDILGSYAAFAAARSYSVFRDHEALLEGDPPEDSEAFVAATREKALVIARDVAATIMASYTVPRGLEGNFNAKISEHGEKAWEFLTTAGMFPAGNMRMFNAAVKRMQERDKFGNTTERSSFKVVEFGADEPKGWRVNADGGWKDDDEALSTTTFTMPLRKGYVYKEGYDTLATEESDWWGEFWGAVINPVGAIFKAVGSFFAGPPENNMACAKVAQVSFSYEYPLMIGFMRKGLFKQDKNADTSPEPFSIYQTCAMPIEPMFAEWPSNEEKEEEDYKPLPADDPKDMQTMRRLNYAVRLRLLDLYDYVYTKPFVEDIHHPGAVTYKGVLKVLEDRRNRNNDDSDWYWDDLKDDSDSPGPEKWEFAKSIADKKVPKSDKFKFTANDVKVVLHEHEKRTDWTSPNTLYDIRRFLEAEIDYRKTVCDKDEYNNGMKSTKWGSGDTNNGGATLDPDSKWSVLSEDVTSWIVTEIQGCIDEIYKIRRDKYYLDKIDGEYSQPSDKQKGDKKIREKYADGENSDGNTIYKYEDVLKENSVTQSDIDESKLNKWNSELSEYSDVFSGNFIPNQEYKKISQGWTNSDLGDKETGTVWKDTFDAKSNWNYSTERDQLESDLDAKLTLYKSKLAAWRGRADKEIQVYEKNEEYLDNFNEIITDPTDLTAIWGALTGSGSYADYGIKQLLITFYNKQREIRKKKDAIFDGTRNQMNKRWDSTGAAK